MRSLHTGSVRVGDADPTDLRVASSPEQDGWNADQLYARRAGPSLHEGIRHVVARGGDVAGCTVAATVSVHHDGAGVEARLLGVPDRGRRQEIVELAASHAPLVDGRQIVVA